MKEMFSVLVAVAVFVAMTPTMGHGDVIADGKKVQFSYTLTVNEQVVESTEGKEPLEYVHGEGKIIPGLEKALAGMDVGQEKKVTVTPADAYGDVIEAAIKEVPKANFPENFDYQVGAVIELQDQEGNAYPGVIWELKDTTVVVNFNHPLAGQTLVFDVKIVAVN